jgi:hypothetical protein
VGYRHIAQLFLSHSAEHNFHSVVAFSSRRTFYLLDALMSKVIQLGSCCVYTYLQYFLHLRCDYLFMLLPLPLTLKKYHGILTGLQLNKAWMVKKSFGCRTTLRRLKECQKIVLKSLEK